MSDYTEIELRVAKAMFDVEAWEDGYPYPWENTSTSRQDRWLARARNALNALRLPISEDMAHAMNITAQQVSQFTRDVERLNYLRSQIGEWDMPDAIEVCEIAKRYMTAANIQALPTPPTPTPE